MLFEGLLSFGLTNTGGVPRQSFYFAMIQLMIGRLAAKSDLSRQSIPDILTRNTYFARAIPSPPIRIYVLRNPDGLREVEFAGLMDLSSLPPMRLQS